MSEDLVQLIVFVLIGVGWAVVNLIKKVDTWIQRNRLPRNMREGQGGQSVSAPPQVPVERAEQRRPTEAGVGRDASQPSAEGQDRTRPRDIRKSLLEEIAQAFEGMEPPSQQPAQQPAPAAAARPGPETEGERPAHLPPVREQRTAPQSAARQHASAMRRATPRRTAPLDSDEAEEGLGGLGTGIAGRRPKGPAKTAAVTAAAAPDARAFLRTRADLRSAIVLSEILGKPKALREGPLADPPELQLRMD